MLSKERGKYFQEKWYEMEYKFANMKMHQQIESLNNVIRELEEELKNDIEYYDKLYEEQDEEEYIDKYFALKKIYESLIKLKEKYKVK